MQREGFASRIGFLLVSAGCAIGLGNVWKFPYITGRYGGGVFVFFYLIFLIVLGLPVLTMELAVGRASRLSITRAYQKLKPGSGMWHLHGFACLLGNYLLMMFYTVVSGWMLNYFVKFLTGTFEGIPEAQIGSVFADMLKDPKEQAFYMGITVLVGVLICSLGIQKGLEKIATVMMTFLLALLLVLVIHSLTLPGSAEGLKFYLLPDFSHTSREGLPQIVTAAMNQSFFTLSVGIASMEIFGSYMSKNYTLGGEAIRICALDTLVAVVSGLIIFPACYSYHVKVDEGPSLIFIALPQVFIHMSGGRLWGALFFLFMTFASFSTIVAVFENIIAMCMELFGWKRKKSSFLNFCGLLIGSIPTVLNANKLSGIHLIGNRDVFESEEFIVSNFLLPLGALIFLLFCVTKWGWGFDRYLAEANTGEGIKLSPKLKPYFQFVLPILIFLIFIQGLL